MQKFRALSILGYGLILTVWKWKDVALKFLLHKFLLIFNLIKTFFDIEERDVLITLWHEKVWTTVVMKLLYIFFILGIPWGLVWTGRRREGSGRGHHQAVWGAVIQELRLVQNPGPSHQQRFSHGIHYSTERGKLLMENNLFSKATSTGISLCQQTVYNYGMW